MACQAITIGYTEVVVDLPHLMGGMAVDTNWYFVWLLLPKFPPNYFAVNLLDQSMTLLAGFRNIVSEYTRTRISMGQEIMRGMTIRANCRNG